MQRVHQSLALIFIPGGHLANEHSGHHRVLIPGVGTHQVAVALLIADNKFLVPGLLVSIDLVADILKPGEGLLNLQAKTATDISAQITGHNGLDQRRFFVQLRFLHGQYKLHQQCAGLVAGKQHIIVAVTHRNAHTVTVRVSAQHQICSLCLCLRDSQSQGVLFLRVGTAHGRKIAVRQFLGLDHRYMHIPQHPSHRHIAGAVERGINDLQIRRLRI